MAVARDNRNGSTMLRLELGSHLGLHQVLQRPKCGDAWRVQAARCHDRLVEQHLHGRAKAVPEAHLNRSRN